jgi:antitoxin component YwqK of YwqJK toxin-antitoxin module
MLIIRILLIVLCFPYLLTGQSDLKIDTLEIGQVESKGELMYRVDSGEPFTGILVDRYNNGALRAVNYYRDGSTSRYTVWDFVNDLRIEQTYTLTGNTWEQISQTNYNSAGQKLMFVDYETNKYQYWYEDGSMKEEKGTLNNEDYLTIWDHNGDEFIPGSTQPRDTADINEMEWPNYLPHRKGNSKPFTGVITLNGTFNYRNFRAIYNEYYSAVNFVFGLPKGVYTTWYQKGGQKLSEKSLQEDPMVGGIKLDGPYKEWYQNGQLKSQGAYFLGDLDGALTTWYENGQIERKEQYNRGKPIGMLSRWYENGQKKMEMTYLDDEVIKITEWDQNGNTIKKWPESDKDKHGLKLFLNQFMSVLKSGDFDGIENLFISKEAFSDLMQRMKIPSTDKEYVKINENWSEFMEYSKKRFDFIRATEDDFFYKEYLKNASIISYLYDYQVVKDNENSSDVKWPESINFDLTNALYVYAKVKVSIGTDERPYTIDLPLLYISNSWYINPLGG